MENGSISRYANPAARSSSSSTQATGGDQPVVPATDHDVISYRSVRELWRGLCAIRGKAAAPDGADLHAVIIDERSASTSPKP
jgi:hypothetical protein